MPKPGNQRVTKWIYSGVAKSRAQPGIPGSHQKKKPGIPGIAQTSNQSITLDLTRAPRGPQEDNQAQIRMRYEYPLLTMHIGMHSSVVRCRPWPVVRKDACSQQVLKYIKGRIFEDQVCVYSSLLTPGILADLSIGVPLQVSTRRAPPFSRASPRLFPPNSSKVRAEG